VKEHHRLDHGTLKDFSVQEITLHFFVERFADGIPGGVCSRIAIHTAAAESVHFHKAGEATVLDNMDDNRLIDFKSNRLQLRLSVMNT
jgi:hypothetical protein